MQRRLSAILAADMVGYSRLIAADEQGTIARQKEHRAALIDPKIAQYGGRIVKTMGDGLLVEFSSAVDAVQCALEIQRTMPEREAEVSENDQIRYRVGINLGDISIDGDDLLGDGVNVAARLEGLSSPGGICISDIVYQTLQGKLAEPFSDLGEQSLKNMDRKVRVWNWTAEGSGLSHAEDSDALPLPDKPSIAVLPFDNMSGDVEQEYFADGISEDIITALSKLSKLFVVARNSTFTYKGRAVDVRKVGKEQGVRYVLEGSVRRGGERVRITAQLIDATTGHHIWAQRYDRVLQDLFELQDEITREITSALQVELTEGEQARLWAGGTQNFEAWELCVHAAELVNNHVREDTQKAKELLERALSLDPNYASAWCKLGWAHWSDGRHHWTPDVGASLNEARNAAKEAQRLDPDAAEPTALLSMTALQERAYEEAEKLALEAIARAGEQSFVLAIGAMVLSLCGRPTEALGHLAKAMRLCPLFPSWYRFCAGRAKYLAGDLEDAIPQIERYRSESGAGTELLIAALFESGRREEASRLAEASIPLGLSIRKWEREQSFKDPAVTERVLQILEELGVPED